MPFETTCRKLVPVKVGMATEAGLFSTQVLTGEQSLPCFEIKGNQCVALLCKPNWDMWIL